MKVSHFHQTSGPICKELAHDNLRLLFIEKQLIRVYSKQQYYSFFLSYNIITLFFFLINITLLLFNHTSTLLFFFGQYTSKYHVIRRDESWAIFIFWYKMSSEPMDFRKFVEMHMSRWQRFGFWNWAYDWLQTLIKGRSPWPKMDRSQQDSNTDWTSST